jgi:predicted dehydrogenase
VQKSNPEARAYPDYKTLLEEEAPDLLVITAYCGFHGTIALECIRRGIHVFTEKPAATRLEELEELEAAYFSQKQAKLSAMMLSRFSPAFQAAKQALDQGAIGTLRFISAQKSYQFGNRGGMYENPDFYGGTIPWVGSHAADWIRWMSGLEFQAVCAVESRAANRGIGRLETAAVCTFTMEKEVLAVCSLDLFYPEGAKAHGDDRLRMVGSKGVLEVVQGRALLTVPEGQQLLQGPQGKSAFTEFLKDIKGEPSQAVRAREVFSVTRACLLARESAARGERICW